MSPPQFVILAGECRHTQLIERPLQIERKFSHPHTTPIPTPTHTPHTHPPTIVLDHHPHPPQGAGVFTRHQPDDLASGGQQLSERGDYDLVTGTHRGGGGGG